MEKNFNHIAFALLLLFFILGANNGIFLLVPLIALAAWWVYKKYKLSAPKIVKNAKYTMSTHKLHTSPLVKRTILTALTSLVLVVILFHTIRIVPAGYTGVYNLFGKVRDQEVPSGIHLINPFATVIPMSIRTESYTMSIAPSEGQRIGDDSIQALTKEGLSVALDMTVLYHLMEDKASDVYRTLGTDYDEKLIRPQVRSAIREVIATYEAKDIYSEKREEAAQRIKTILATSLNERGIAVESVLLRNVSLPSMLTQAIEAKLTAEQEAQKYDFILEKERKEAERKRIEAEGQRDAQQIINQGLTDRYLQYLYVQNIEKREGTIYVPYNLPLFKGI